MEPVPYVSSHLPIWSSNMSDGKAPSLKSLSWNLRASNGPLKTSGNFYSLKACSSTLPNHTTCLAYLAIDQGHSGQVSDIDGSILIQVILRSIQQVTTACSKVEGKNAQVENLHPTIAIIVD